MTVVSTPGPGLEQLAGDPFLGRVDRRDHRRREVRDEHEVAGLAAIAMDRDRLAGQPGTEPRRNDAALVQGMGSVGVGEAKGAGDETVRRGVGLA